MMRCFQRRWRRSDSGRQPAGQVVNMMRMMLVMMLVMMLMLLMLLTMLMLIVFFANTMMAV